MSRFCLDTSAYSHFFRGHGAAVNAIDGAEWIGVPVVTLGELETGLALGGRRRENQTQLEAFLDHPVVETLPTDRAMAMHYGDLMVALRRAGTPVPTNDVWIGAASLATESEVLIYDSHFLHMPGVRCRLLQAAE